MVIESGMALFAIQLVRVVIISLVDLQEGESSLSLLFVLDLVIIIHQMLNVIIRSAHFLLIFFITDNIFYLPRALHQQ